MQTKKTNFGMPFWSIFHVIYIFFSQKFHLFLKGGSRLPNSLLELSEALSKYNPMMQYLLPSHLQSIPESLLKVAYLKELTPLTGKRKSSRSSCLNAHIPSLFYCSSALLCISSGEFTLPDFQMEFHLVSRIEAHCLLFSYPSLTSQ